MFKIITVLMLELIYIISYIIFLKSDKINRVDSSEKLLYAVTIMLVIVFMKFSISPKWWTLTITIDKFIVILTIVAFFFVGKLYKLWNWLRRRVYNICKIDVYTDIFVIPIYIILFAIFCSSINISL